MCYPHPGPRCSKHAFQEYIEADKKFQLATTPQEKLIYGRKLEEKREAYETTPKGLNELRRLSDAVRDGIGKDELLLRIQNGENRRAKMLEDYHYVIDNQNSDYKDIMKDKGYSSGTKYQQACGISLMFLSNRLPDSDFHIETMDTIANDNNKIFVIPEKYQDKWATYRFDGKKYSGASPNLLQLLTNHSNLTTPPPTAIDPMFEWFIAALEQEGYTAFSGVNINTQNVVIGDLNKLKQYYNIKFKLRPRISGTRSYIWDEQELKTLLKGTIFETGTIIQPDGLKKQILSGIPKQDRSLCSIGEFLYLSWKQGNTNDTNGGWYEIRRKNPSNVFEIWVRLEAQNVLKASGIYKDALQTNDEYEEMTDEDFGEPKFLSQIIEDE